MWALKGIWAVSVILKYFDSGFVFAQEADAITFTATHNGNWNDATTWWGAVPPTSIAVGDSVIIPSAKTVTIPSDVTIFELYYDHVGSTSET